MTETTTYAYDGVGQLIQVTMPDSTLIYTYDEAHRLTDIADSLGNTVHYTLDAMGNRTGEQAKDANGTLARQLTRVYDALNRLQQITGGVQNTTSYQYDPNGNVTQITDPLGHVTNQAFDALNRLTQQLQPAPAAGAARPTITYAYDGQDHLASVTDPRNLITRYTVDGLGNQTAIEVGREFRIPMVTV